MTDGRRRQWVAVPTDLPHDEFGAKIYDRFGIGGMAVWCLLWIAVKRSLYQGSLTFSSDEEFWRLLGLSPSDAGFDVSAFISAGSRSGDLKRTRRGRTTTVTLTRWLDFNSDPRTGSGRKNVAARQSEVRSAPKERQDSGTDNETEREQSTATGDTEGGTATTANFAEVARDRPWNPFSLAYDEGPSPEVMLALARLDVERKVDHGYAVESTEALARHLANDGDFQSVARDLYDHPVDCRCGGEGFYTAKASGRLMRCT